MAVSYSEKFEQFQHQLLGTYATYYVWKSLQKTEYEELYRVNNGFWSAAIPALQHEWFLMLARAFENSKYTKKGDVVSVYSLIQEHPNPRRAQEAIDFLDKNKTVLDNIARIRDHVHAHNNLNFLLNPKEFERRFSVKYDDIESIFEFANKLLGLVHPEDDHGYILDHMKEDAERDTADVMKGLKYFNDKRNEHRQNWVSNGGNPNFPPEEQD